MGMVMLFVKRSMTKRQKDQWRFLGVLQFAGFGGEWVVQVYSIVMKGGN